MNTRPLLISAAITGTLAALLSEVPLVNMVNCLFCGWLWIQGVAVVFLYRSLTGEYVDYRRGMILGAVGGLFGAAVSIFLSLITGMNSTPIPPDQLAQIEEQFGDAADFLTSPAFGVTAAIILNLVFFPLFGTVGGFIGSLIMKQRAG